VKGKGREDEKGREEGGKEGEGERKGGEGCVMAWGMDAPGYRFQRVCCENT